jgi:S-adenosylmethionine:tRNA ribosyltransferase-isomerase
MRVALLDYALAPGSIAQVPAEDRLSARLLELPADGEAAHRHIRDLPDRIPEGSLVVVNDTRVLRARLLGRKRGSGGKAEVFLVRRADVKAPGEASRERWWALGKASKGLRAGMVVDCGPLEARIIGLENELLDIELSVPSGVLSVAEAVRSVGHMPLPPYIRRDDSAADVERYQTVFARVDGAVAAPTAGLHLSHGLLARLEARGCIIASVTLHVGLGTFQPVTALDLDDHPMHEEAFDIPEASANAITAARERGAAVVAIGTTVVRALESAADPSRPGHVLAGSGETRLLIQPGYRFQVIDRLFTNFHLPKSTLLALVSAFAGPARTLDAYKDAQARGYRFFSYGDAMLLEPSADARGATPTSPAESR